MWYYNILKKFSQLKGGFSLFKNLFPDILAESIYDIDFFSLKEKGIKGIILDIDNTLVPHTAPTPDGRALELISNLKDMGFSLAIISNGKPDRVKKFTEGFDIPVIWGHIKPKKSGYVLALSSLNVKPNECAAIGDQIFTDVLGANRMGILSVYTTPIIKYENWFFYIKRFFETFILQKLK